MVKMEHTDNDSESRITRIQFEQIALTTLGIFLLYRAITDIVYHTIDFAQAMAGFPFDMEKPNRSFIFTPEFLATIFEIILSSWLILSSKGIAVFIKKIRTE
jgi:hypothetical protein